MFRLALTAIFFAAACRFAAISAALLPLSVAAESETSLIVIGGSQTTSGGSATASVDIISLTTNKHKSGKPAPAPISMFGSVLVNDTIYVVGGDYHNNFWAYNIPTNKWAVMPDFPETNAGSTLSEINGTLIAVGGYRDKQNQPEHVYAYDLSDGEDGVWVPHGARPTGLGICPCAVTVRDTIFYLDFNQYRSDDAGQTWQSISNMPQPTTLHACVAVGNDQILATGGAGNEGANAWFQTYNITANSWTSSWAFPEARRGHAAVVLPDGNLLVCGGDMNFGPAFADCVTYDVKMQQWGASKYRLDQPRTSFGMFVTQTPVSSY